jgi:hypothetical protein
METTRWTNPSQPQTLQSSVILLYVSAALGVLFGPSSLGILFAAGRVAGGWGCANERKWGYQLAVAVAVLPFVLFLSVADLTDHLFTTLFVFAFDILLLALLLHPQSRSYQRIWFR